MQTFTIAVNHVNSAPAVTGSTTFTTLQNTAIAFDFNSIVTDADGDALSVSQFGQGSHGAVGVSGSTVTYSPDFLFTGTDTFAVYISDGHGGILTLTITVHVGPNGITVNTG